MAKVSVIIPIYNVEDYLKECLDSVINQTLEDIEIICVNDGSTDGSLNIIKSYDDERIKLINQENQGLSASRNVGLDNATGDYVCFLDADDYLILTALEELYDIVESKSLDFVMFKLRNFDTDTREELEHIYFEMIELKEKVKDNVFSFNDYPKEMFYTSVTAPGKLFKHDLIKDIRFPVGLIFEDNTFFTEVILNNAERIYIYDKYLYFRRVRQGSITNSSSQRYSDWLEISDMLMDITKKYGVYEKYGYIVYSKKFSNTYRIFRDMVDDECKPYFFKKLKQNFKEFGEKNKDDAQFNNMYSRLRFIYNAGLDCETAEEFEYTVRNYDLNDSNKKLRRKNNKLKKEIKEFEKVNNIILNSTSWKATKPLRNFKNLFKENK